HEEQGAFPAGRGHRVPVAQRSLRALAEGLAQALHEAAVVEDRGQLGRGEDLHRAGGPPASLQRATRSSRTSRGSAPAPSTTSWKLRRSKAAPRSRAARARSSRIFSSPIL